MRIDWSTLALQLVNFAILVWLLQRFLYRPVLRMVDARRAAIDEQYAAAGRAVAEGKAQLAGLEAQRAGIAAESAAALKSAADEAQRQAAARRAQAEREAEALMTEARKTLAQERAHALDETRRAALALAVELARRVLAEVPESLRTQAWLERIERYLASRAPAERAELAGEIAGGAELRVVTAAPLAADDTERWRERFRRAFGADIAMSFDADPQLIGGAELHLPHATLDFSIRGAIATLEKTALAGAGKPQGAATSETAPSEAPNRDEPLGDRGGRLLGHTD